MRQTNPGDGCRRKQPGAEGRNLCLSGDAWWVQPLATTPNIKFGAEGKWESQTHGGTEFVALLVKSSYQPQAWSKAVPEVGGEVLAIAKKKPETKRCPMKSIVISSVLVVLFFTALQGADQAAYPPRERPLSANWRFLRGDAVGGGAATV